VIDAVVTEADILVIPGSYLQTMGPSGSSLAQLHGAQALGLDFDFAPAQWIDNVRDGSIGASRPIRATRWRCGRSASHHSRMLVRPGDALGNEVEHCNTGQPHPGTNSDPSSYRYTPRRRALASDARVRSRVSMSRDEAVGTPRVGRMKTPHPRAAGGGPLICDHA